MDSLTKEQKDFILALFDNGLIKFGEFKFKIHDTHPDAPLAPFYIDLRMLRRFPDIREKAVNIYKELIGNLEFDLIADVPTAATPIASILAHILKVPMITPRKDNKAHGNGAKIDGVLEVDKGKVAVIVDDLITHAESKFEAIESLEEFGIKIKDVLVLIDREQGGKEELAKAGYKLHASFTLSQMMELYKNENRLNDLEYKQAMDRLNALNTYIQNL